MSSSSSHYGDIDTRQGILAEAWDLLEEKGSEPTLAEIAEKAGVSRQAIYLHFGDRSGLFVALVDYVDLSLGSEKLRSHVFGAPTGVETLRRWVETMSWYTGKIDRMAQVLEAGQYNDEALAAGWRNRMNRRQALLLGVAERIAGEGRLANDWTPAEAADLVYTITMPGPWRELTKEIGWTEDQYKERIWKFLELSMLTVPLEGQSSAEIV